MKVKVEIEKEQSYTAGILFNDLCIQEDGLYMPVVSDSETVKWRLLLLSDVTGDNKTILYLSENDQIISPLIKGHGFGMFRYIKTKEELEIKIR